MRKPIIALQLLCCAVALLSANAFAQQTQAPPASATKKPAATAQKPAAAAAAPKSTGSAALTTDRDKESYAFGMNVGKGLKNQSVDIDPAMFLRGMKDQMSGAKTLLTDEEAMASLKKLQADSQAKQEQKMKELGEKNASDGARFLAANKTKPGVVTLPSGLQYKIITQGTGPKPMVSDTVVCQYRGTLIDGTEFDDSAKHGGSATFPVGRIIKGWTEALQLMPVGSKWQLFIPPDLAYGDRGAPGSPIGPNATLIFDVELVQIKPPAAPPAPSTQPPPNK